MIITNGVVTGADLLWMFVGLTLASAACVLLMEHRRNRRAREWRQRVSGRLDASIAKRERSA